MRYFSVRLRQKQTDELYRIYVTDGLYALSNRGHRLARRYFDIAHPERVPEETRTPEEIINAIKSKLERMA